jgi:hypothetical protein
MDEAFRRYQEERRVEVCASSRRRATASNGSRRSSATSTCRPCSSPTRS